MSVSINSDKKIIELGKNFANLLLIKDIELANELARLTIEKLPNGKPSILHLNNFEIFAKIFIQISDKEEKKDVPLTLNVQQQILLGKMIEQNNRIEILQNIIPKSRQIGITTFFDSVELQYGLRVDKTVARLIVHRGDLQKAQIVNWKNKVSLKLMCYMYTLCHKTTPQNDFKKDVEDRLRAWFFGMPFSKTRIDKANTEHFSLFNGSNFGVVVADNSRPHLIDMGAGQRIDVLRINECSNYGWDLIATTVKSVSAKRGFMITLESTIKARGAIYEMLQKHKILERNAKGEDINTIDFQETADWQFHFYNWLQDIEGSSVLYVPPGWVLPQECISELKKRGIDYNIMPIKQQYWLYKGMDKFNSAEKFFYEEPICLQDCMVEVENGNWFNAFMVEKAVNRRVKDFSNRDLEIWNSSSYVDISVDLGFRKDKTVMVAGALAYDKLYDRIIGTIGELYPIPSQKNYSNSKEWYSSLAKTFVEIWIKYQMPLVRIFHIDSGGPAAQLFDEDIKQSILEAALEYDNSVISERANQMLVNLYINKFENIVLSNNDLLYFPEKKNFMTRNMVCLDYLSRGINSSCINIPSNANLLTQIGRVEIAEDKGKLREIGKHKNIKKLGCSPDELDAVCMLFDMPFIEMRRQSITIHSFDSTILQ